MAERITPEKSLDLKTTRKPGSWSEVVFLTKPSKGQLAYLKGLPCYPSSEDYHPMDDLVKGPGAGIKMPQRFVVANMGAYYYVNTEGYSYCRYALRVPAETFGMEEIVQVPQEEKTEPEPEPAYEPAAVLPDSYKEAHHKKLVLAAKALTCYLEYKEHPEGCKLLVKMLNEAIKDYENE
jgi:hypothetical protein